MHSFQDDYVFLKVDGYEVLPQDVLYFSSAPLFTYNKFDYSEADWGVEQCHFPNFSFWLTEFCAVLGSEETIIHEIPGAYLRLNGDSKSSREFDSAWRNRHDKYVFRKREIIPQKCIQKTFEQIIKRGETILFHDGGLFEEIIAELCGARGVVNLKTDLNFRMPISSVICSASENRGCKVHRRYLQFCPREQAEYYMKHVSEWLPKYNHAEESWGDRTEESWGGRAEESWGDRAGESWGDRAEESWGDRTEESWGDRTEESWGDRTEHNKNGDEKEEEERRRTEVEEREMLLYYDHDDPKKMYLNRGDRADENAERTEEEERGDERSQATEVVEEHDMMLCYDHGYQKETYL